MACGMFDMAVSTRVMALVVNTAKPSSVLPCTSVAASVPTLGGGAEISAATTVSVPSGRLASVRPEPCSARPAASRADIVPSMGPAHRSWTRLDANDTCCPLTRAISSSTCSSGARPI